MKRDSVVRKHQYVTYFRKMKLQKIAEVEKYYEAKNTEREKKKKYRKESVWLSHVIGIQ